MTKRSHSFTEAQNALQSLLSQAEIYQLSNMSIFDKFQDLRNRFNLPIRQWSYLQGYYACRRDLWQRSFRYCVKWKDKWITMDWDTIPKECRVELRKNLDLPTAHFWVKENGSLGRPYSDISDIEL